MVGIGVGIIDGSKPSSVGIKKLANLSPGILVIAAVNLADVLPTQLYKSDFCRTLDVIALFGNLYQFKHGFFLPSPI